MALWRIIAKSSTNAPCKNKRQKIEKGMRSLICRLRTKKESANWRTD